MNDIVWVPALIGSIYEIYSMFPNLELQLIKLGLIGGIALLFAYLGAIGQADSIALVFVAADPYKLSPILPLICGRRSPSDTSGTRPQRGTHGDQRQSRWRGS